MTVPQTNPAGDAPDHFNTFSEGEKRPMTTTSTHGQCKPKAKSGSKTKTKANSGSKTKANSGSSTRGRGGRPADGKTSRQRVEDAVADRIIELLDQGQLPPWEKDWRDSANGIPRNAVSMKPYRGVNRWMTLLTHMAMGYQDPRWLTYRQAEALGGHVRKGETSTEIVFWKRVPFRDREDDGGNGLGRDDQPPEEEGKIRTYPMLRSYRVFNVEQTEDCRIEPLPQPEAQDHDPIEQAEAIIAGMPGPPEFQTYQNANHAPHYAPAMDTVRVPDIGRYRSTEGYYNTVFHELVHSTGHPKRLDRFNLDANAGDLHAYGREEMTAGMGAAMLAAHAGTLAEAMIERDASYILHWRDAIKADKSDDRPLRDTGPTGRGPDPRREPPGVRSREANGRAGGQAGRRTGGLTTPPAV